jgi:hypothetical protein
MLINMSTNINSQLIKGINWNSHHIKETNLVFFPVWPEQWVSVEDLQAELELTPLKEEVTPSLNMASKEIKARRSKTTNTSNKMTGSVNLGLSESLPNPNPWLEESTTRNSRKSALPKSRLFELAEKKIIDRKNRQYNRTPKKPKSENRPEPSQTRKDSEISEITKLTENSEKEKKQSKEKSKRWSRFNKKSKWCMIKTSWSETKRSS